LLRTFDYKEFRKQTWKIHGYDLAQGGKHLFTWKDFPEGTFPKFGKDSSRFITGEERRKICFWDVRTQQRRRTLDLLDVLKREDFEEWSDRRDGPNGPKMLCSKVGASAWSPCGRKVLLSGPERLVLLDLEQNKTVELRQVLGPTIHRMFSADGTSFATITVTYAGPGMPPNDKKSPFGLPPPTYTLSVWETQTGALVARHKLEQEHKLVCFTPDGAGLVSISKDNCLTMYHVKTGRMLWRHPLKLEVCGVAFSAAGRTLAIGTEDGKVHVYDFNPRTP
jgi:WD40 repeat protein